jgi:hypothetical protein
MISRDWQPSADTVSWIKATFAITDAQFDAKVAKLRALRLGTRSAAQAELELRDWIAND